MLGLVGGIVLFRDNGVGLGSIAGVGTGADTRLVQRTGYLNDEIGGTVPVIDRIEGMMHPTEIACVQRQIGGGIDWGKASDEIAVGEDTQCGGPYLDVVIAIGKCADVVAQGLEVEGERADVACTMSGSLYLLGGEEILLLHIALLGVVGRREVIAHHIGQVTHMSVGLVDKSDGSHEECIGVIDSRSNIGATVGIDNPVTGIVPNHGCAIACRNSDKGVDIVIRHRGGRSYIRHIGSVVCGEVATDSVILLISIGSVCSEPRHDMECGVGGEMHVDGVGEGVGHVTTGCKAVGNRVGKDRGATVEAIVNHKRGGCLQSIVVDSDRDRFGGGESTSLGKFKVVDHQVNRGNVGDMDTDLGTLTFATVVEIEDKVVFDLTEMHGVGIGGHLPKGSSGSGRRCVGIGRPCYTASTGSGCVDRRRGLAGTLCQVDGRALPYGSRHLLVAPCYHLLRRGGNDLIEGYRIGNTMTVAVYHSEVAVVCN